MKTPTILVVEDNPITRKMLLVALATEGYAVLEAPDGGTALELAERNAPDLILQDLMLPDMDGFELVEKLRKLPGGAEIPILACSGFVSRIEALRAASVGFNDFVAKPVEPSRLMAVIRSYLPHPPAPSEKLGRGRRLLLADDDPVQLKLGRLRLGELAFQVTTAANGIEALELARESPPDIIVSDVLMPQMDGFRLCVAVRQDPRLARVPVVLVSSNYIQESDRELARKLGASAYTFRTPGLEELIEALRSLDEGAPASQVSAEVLDERLNERVRQQLEHQVAMSAGLMQRLSLQASMLSIMAGLSRALAHPLDIKVSLAELLDVVLDAVGVSLGVLYLVGPEGDLCFESQRGYSGSDTEGPQACFGYRELLSQALARGSPVAIPSEVVPGEAGQDLLARAAVASALLVPIVWHSSPMGILLLGSQRRGLTHRDWGTFAEAVALQIGQTITLSRAIARLAASEERYRGLFERNLAGVFLTTLDGRIVDCNDACVRIFGFASPQELRAAPANDFFIAPTEREPLLAQLQQQKALINHEICLRKKDGSPVWVMVNANLLEGQRTEAAFIQATLIDITQRKRSEEALIERTRLAAFSSEVGLVLTQSVTLQEALGRCAEAIVRHLDAAFARIWTLNAAVNMLELQASAGMYTHLDGGHSRAPVGKFKIGLIAQERKPHLTNAVVGDPRVHNQEWAEREGMVAFAGYPLIVDEQLVGVMAMFARNPLGEATLEAMASVANAVALAVQRKQAEEELRRSQAALETAQARAKLGSWQLDSRTMVGDWSKEMYRLFGRDAALGAPTFAEFLELIHPEDRRLLEEHVKAPTPPTPGQTSPIEFRSNPGRGTMKCYLATIGSIRGADGTVARLEGTVLDITERKQLEEQLRQSQKMEAVGQLAGGVAHDFNNLLTVIKGYGDILLDELEPGNERLRRAAEEIYRSADRAASLTRQLLAFSRRQVLEPKVLDVNDVVAGMDKMLRRLIGEHIELLTVRKPGVGRVKADPGQIEQVILNLAVNARDAMPQGGKLIIETANVEMDETYVQRHAPVRPGPYVMLAVSDTGCGMDAHTLTRIFDPFFTTKEPGKGTGLGLSTVYGIVKQSGGNIWAYSEPGQGTTFKVYLPRVEEGAEAPSVEKRKQVAARGSETVLLVEDEAPLRALIHQTLERHGYRLLEAKDSADALRIAEQHREPINLLLTDVVMPQMGGPALADLVRPLHPETRVLFISGYTNDAIVHHGVLHPGIAFLQKPFNAADLTCKVREVLEQKA